MSRKVNEDLARELNFRDSRQVYNDEGRNNYK